MFQTKYNRHHDFTSICGDQVIKEPVYDENNEIVDYVVTDLDALIQSNRDNGNVQLILERYAVTGDDSFLNVGNSFYADVTNSQSMDSHQRFYANQNAIDLYNSMPDSVKELYPTAEDFYQNVDDMRVSKLLQDNSLDDLNDSLGKEVINE